MKSLALYVDKWFITVAINIDGNVMPLTLPSGEDRIWLFFHEDIPNNRVEYGKSFENDYRDQRPHFIGDVFSLITEGDHHFTRYEKRREDMKEIFKVSGIFSHLHQAVGEDGCINTYISFSSDISDVARLRFIEELEEHDFKVIESVARISHLALEECRQCNVLFFKHGAYIVLAATNENLYYSLYEYKGDLFLRVSEGKLPGLGLDMRRRALVEMIVENINHNYKLLQTREEIEQEYVRQDRFAARWLEQIERTKPYMPAALESITFAVAPNNPTVVQVLPSILEDRTFGLVDDIVRKIAEFIRENNLELHEIEGVVFVGNTFTNPTFTKAIKNRLVISDDKIVTYREDKLPKIVNVYSKIDCNQFNGATSKFYEDANIQATLIKLAKEEAEKKRKAEEEIRKQQELLESQKEADQAYSNAVENIERYEREHNYEEMLEWAEIALKNRPNEEYATKKAALARQLQTEQRVAIKNFNAVIERAKTAFSEERWSDAISQCEIALEIQPNSDIAVNLKKEARRKMGIKEKTQNLLIRANTFFAQKLYPEALKEVEKILNLDSTNEEGIQIKEKISAVFAENKKKIENLIQSLSEVEKKKDFPAAIQICCSLIKEDSINISKWTSRKERIVSTQREFEENKRKLNELRKEINTAHFNEDWVKFKFLCESYLGIEFDSEISRFLAKSKKRLQEIKEKEERDKILASINSLIIDGKINEAENQLDIFARNYPSEQILVRDIRKRLFNFGSNLDSKFEKPMQPSNWDGNIQSNNETNDDFFQRQKNTMLRTKKSKAKKENQTDIKKRNDFFS